MSDGSNPGGNSLPGKVLEWATEFYHVMAWSMTAMGPQPEDTAAVAMLSRLQPRPVDMTAPVGATKAEAQAIDDAYGDLIAQLETHGYNPDLGDAEARAQAIRVLVAAVPKRIERDGVRRTAVLETLGGVKAPVGVTRLEGVTLVADVEALTRRADAAAGPEFDQVETDTALLAQRPAQLGLAVGRRGEEAAALLARLVKCTAPAGCLDSEGKAITDREAVLTAGLKPPFDDKMLTDTTQAVGLLEGDVAKLGEVVARRGEDAAALKLRLQKCTAPAGCLDEEGKAITDRDAVLTKGLTAPYDDKMLSDTAVAVGALESDIAKLGQVVAKRDQDAKALLARLVNCKPPAGCLATEAKVITDQEALLTASLKAPFGDKMIGDATIAVGVLEGDIVKLGEVVAKRDLDAKALLARLVKCTAPVGCLVGEGKVITDKEALLTAGLKPPYGDQMLADATLAVGTLESDIVKLAAVVLARGQRAAKQVIDLDGIAVPPGANKAETDEIVNGVAAAKLPLKAPYDDTMLDDADKAILALGARILAIGLAATDRTAKRKALTDRLDKLVFAPEATPAELSAFGKTRKACVKEITAANEDGLIATADASVDKLEKEVAAHVVFAAARGVGQRAIDDAKLLLKTEGPAVDQGFQVILGSAIGVAQGELAKATKKSDVDALVIALGLAAVKLADAKVFSGYSDTWIVKTQVYIDGSVAVLDKPDVILARNTALAAALVKAKAGDYAGAKVALDGFETAAKVTKSDLDDAELYRVRLKDFQNDNGDKIAAIEKSKIPGGPKVLGDIALAKGIATAGGLYNDAIVALDGAEIDIAALFAVIDTWRKTKALVTAANDAIKAAVTQAELELNADDYATALGTLNALSGPIKDKANAKARLQKLQNEAASMGSRLVEPQKSWIKATLALASPQINANLVTANTHMDTARDRMAEVGPWIEVNNRVKALEATHAAGPLGLLAAANGKVAGDDYVGARADLLIAEPILQAVGAFRPLEALVARMLAAQAGGTPAYIAINTALTEARALLDPGKKPVDATARLQLLLAQPDHQAASAEMMVWQKRLAATTKRQARVLKLIAKAEPKTALVDSLKAAADKGEVDNKLDEATVLLNTHDALLAKGQELASTRSQMIALREGLTRAKARFPVTDHAAIFEGKTEVDLDKDLQDADNKAKALDFDGAIKDFRALIADCKKMAANTAKLYETADGTGSNAGHSLDRHGPDITDDKLLTRLQTGVAPDGKVSYCSASSRFDDPASWLAGREMAAKEAEAAGINLSETNYSLTPEPMLKYEAEIDHGGPIDKAFVGVKKNTGLRKDGSIGELDSYETFVEKKGITKSKSLMLFVIDPPPDGNPDRPKTLSAYKDRYKKMIEAENAAELIRPIPPPPPRQPPKPTAAATIAGKWVMMQHFPLVEGWNQETGEYDE